MSKRLAFIISRALGPLPLLCLLWLVTAVKSGIGFWKALWVYPLILLVSLGIPVSITSYLVSKKIVKSIDWPNLQERKKYLPPLAFFSIVTLNIMSYYLTNETIFHLGILLSAIIATMIFFWAFLDRKVSGHMVIAFVTFSGINLFFHLQFLWIYLLIIPIYWARITLGVHTPKQLLAGIFIPAFYILVGILLFGWPNVP